LKSLDVSAFKKFVSNLLDEMKNVRDKNALQQLFYELFDKIESIKSYGIKGKKRNLS